MSRIRGALHWAPSIGHLSQPMPKNHGHVKRYSNKHQTVSFFFLLCAAVAEIEMEGMLVLSGHLLCVNSVLPNVDVAIWAMGLEVVEWVTSWLGIGPDKSGGDIATQVHNDTYC